MNIELCYVAPMAVCALGIALNSTELIMFCWKKVTCFDTLLISLSLCDLFICVSSFLRMTLVDYFLIDQGRFSAITYGAIVFSHICALANTWMITINRMVVIIFPLRSRVWTTKSRMIKVLITIWALSTSVMVGFIILQYYLCSIRLISIVVAPLYALTFFMLVISYSIMFAILKKSNHRMKRSFHGDDEAPNVAFLVKSNSQEKKMLVLSFRIVISFVICSVPYLVFSSMFRRDPLLFCKANNGLFFVISVTLLTLNSVLDPLFYFHMQRQRGQSSTEQFLMHSRAEVSM